jgi:nitroimidazol reductase NimA-like FMN-containing flavoprotein (pyridoxamine 5'-phosphate oxidase superfamily)
MAEPTPPPRSRAERIHDTLALLAREVDCWVASASAEGDAYLVPLSFAWDGQRIILATAQATRTARDLQRAGRARLAFGALRDVVTVDGTVETIASAALDEARAQLFATRAEWDPRQEPKPYIYLIVTPQRIQAWRNVPELADRTIMARGQWL